MELIHVAIARSIWLFSFQELNQRGLRLFPTIVDAVRARYDFVKEAAPTKPEDQTKFKNGAFKSPTGEIVVSLEIYNDGLIAETSSNTDDSDSFLEDLLTWGKREFSLNYYPGLVKSKGYASEVVIHSVAELNSVCEKLHRFAGRLSSIQAEIVGNPKPQELVSIYFGANLETIASFTFERRAGIPWAENKFYSRAPLSTKSHLELLKEFESIMAA